MKSPILLILFLTFTVIISFPFSSSPLISAILSKKNITNLKDEEEDEKNSYRGQLFGIIRDELLLINFTDVSIGCEETINYYLLGKNQDSENISYIRSTFHLIKGLDDSGKKLNDLLSYDQCMKKNYRFNDTKLINTEKTTRNTYVIVVVDKISNDSNKDKYESLFETKYYLLGLCLPQGYTKGEEYKFIKNNKTYYRFCTDGDYEKIISQGDKQLGDYLLKEAKITAFSLRINQDDEEKESYIILKFLPAIILLLIVIFVFLRNLILKLINLILKLINLIYENKKLKNKIKNNNEYNEDEEEEETDENLTSTKKNDNFNNFNNFNIYCKNIFKCFSFIENKNELFNFSLTSTKYNNDSGISNIRGIKGMAIFFMLIGWTFIVLYNSPLKIYSVRRFLELLNDFFYILVIVGIRYSPRIILSCSGYTLVYKYLSYLDMNLENEKGNLFNVFLRFILYQLHKYILLIMMLLFSRYSFYPLVCLSGENPMWKYLNKMILSNIRDYKFYLSFTSLTFLFGWDKESNMKISHNLLDYFWLPFNEVFCCVFGVILIAIGYKFKCRIDIFILFFIPIWFIIKIIFSYIYEGYDNFLPTLYYYFFDYGKFMTNPLFNITYFLIGLYFGLMNYTVQKGIIDLKSSKNYEKFQQYVKEKKFELLEKKDKEDIEKSFEENNNNNDKKQNDYCEEIKTMPFLITPIIFVKWHRRHQMKYFFIIILSIFLILFIFFTAIHYIIINYIIIKYEIDQKETEISKKIDDYIKNTLINFFFRFDIEFIVLFIQWGAFIIYFKGNNILADFLTHQFWTMLSKPYFSFILIINPVLLFMFYKGETLIGLNSINLFLYSVIGGFFTFVVMCFAYIFFELPLKRLSHLIINKNWIDEEDLEQDDEDEEYKNLEENDNENISTHKKNN